MNSNMIYEKNDIYHFEISKSFKTKSEITKRTIIVSEAFGIGIDDEQEFKIYQNFRFSAKKKIQ